jgi:D-cysteine desulfhydrase family pyridoxal phosphate-dependent enzyme
MKTNSEVLSRLSSFPRVKIAHVPTALEEMPNLTRALGGPELFVKRDDNTGVAFGGNKARQLEYYFGEALEQGADTILITGAVQSNYARMTAAVSARLGMECHIQLEERVSDTDELYRTSGNVLLDRLMGAKIHSYPEGEDERGADLALEKKAEDLRRKGAKPYVIPLGPGHPPLGALGYIEAAAEFLNQLDEKGMKIDDIIIPSGSGLTQGGLLFGLRALGSSIRVTGNCHRRTALFQKERIAQVIKGISELLGIDDPIKEEDIVLYDIAIGPGYGLMDAGTREAILLAAQKEALFCDPVYSGKAMAGMISLIREGRFRKDSHVLFWHTGGQPAIFAYGSKIFE